MTDFERFWELYPNKKGKGAARKAFEKAMQGNDQTALFKDMELALEAQKRYRNEARLKNEFMPPWKHPSTWLNQECWLDEIASHADLKQKYESKFCFCGKETHGPKFQYCAEHLQLDEHGRFRDVLMAPEIREYYRKHPEIHGLTGRDAVQWITKMRLKPFGAKT